MNKQLRIPPKFTNEAEERAFWEAHDSTDYLDWTKAQRVVLPNLKPTTKQSRYDCLSTCSIQSRRQPTRGMFHISH